MNLLLPDLKQEHKKSYAEASKIDSNISQAVDIAKILANWLKPNEFSFLSNSQFDEYKRYQNKVSSLYDAAIKNDAAGNYPQSSKLLIIKVKSMFDELSDKNSKDFHHGLEKEHIEKERQQRVYQQRARDELTKQALQKEAIAKEVK